MSLFWGKSKCKGTWLHRYHIVEQGTNFVKERCEICKKQVVYKFIYGKINNFKYLEDHKRQALPVYHNRFKKEYGEQRFISSR